MIRQLRIRNGRNDERRLAATGSSAHSRADAEGAIGIEVGLEV